MKSHLMSIALAVLVLAAASSGCTHRTTTMHHTDTVTTDSTPREVTPHPMVDVTTTVIKHSHLQHRGETAVRGPREVWPSRRCAA
jgi:hypothetical protein